jgi:hypothetical protein
MPPGKGSEMRTGIAILVAAGWIAGVCTGALAQSSSPEAPPWFGGVARTPTFSVRLPEGWIAVDRARSVDEQLATAVDHLAADGIPVSAADLRAAFTRSEGVGDCMVIVDTTTLDSCGILHGSKTSPGMVGSGPLSAEVVGGYLLDGLAALSTTTSAEPLEAVDLAAGPAVRLDLSVEDPAQPQASGPLSMYIAVTDDRLLMLTCSSANERPTDRWLPIAMTLEFLP